MRRTFPLLALLLAAALAPAACSKSASYGNACALASACFGSSSASFTEICSPFFAYAEIDRSLLSPSDQLLGSLVDCMNGASDCAAAKACAQANSAEAAVCETGGTHCFGNVLVDCDETLEGTPSAYDCGALGLLCVASDGRAACGSAKCDPATTKQSCDGDMRVRCKDPGVLVAESCKLTFGMECIGNESGTSCHVHVADGCAVVDGVATCVGTGAACGAAFQDHCEGSVIVGCTEGKEARYDCAAFIAGATCKIDAEGAATCIAGTECDPQEFDETCEGGVITYCQAGTKATVDCKSAGLSGCATATHGGHATAHCVP